MSIAQVRIRAVDLDALRRDLQTIAAVAAEGGASRDPRVSVTAVAVLLRRLRDLARLLALA